MNRRRDADGADPTPSDDRNRALMIAELPVVQRRLPVAGVSTTVLEGGDGPPLILLHGGIECGGVIWGPVVAELARGHRLVIPDLPGLGESDPVAALAASFDTWFADLVRLTCPEKPTLVAHSLGGGLAARFAVRYGALLDRLVIYGSPTVAQFRLPLGLQLAAIRYGLRPTQRNNERVNRWFLLDLARTRALDQIWFDAFDAYSRARGRVPHVKRTIGHLLKTQTKRIPDADLERIGVPVSLLWGRHDRVVPLCVGEEASSRHGWPLHVIDNAGHVPHIERTTAFLRVLSDIGRLRPRDRPASSAPHHE